MSVAQLVQKDELVVHLRVYVGPIAGGVLSFGLQGAQVRRRGRRWQPSRV